MFFLYSFKKQKFMVNENLHLSFWVLQRDNIWPVFYYFRFFDGGGGVDGGERVYGVWWSHLCVCVVRWLTTSSILFLYIYNICEIRVLKQNKVCDQNRRVIFGCVYMVMVFCWVNWEHLKSSVQPLIYFLYWLFFLSIFLSVFWHLNLLNK